MSGMLCDRRMNVKIKVNVCMTVVRLALLYCASLLWGDIGGKYGTGELVGCRINMNTYTNWQDKKRKNLSSRQLKFGNLIFRWKTKHFRYVLA